MSGSMARLLPRWTARLTLVLGAFPPSPAWARCEDLIPSLAAQSPALASADPARRVAPEDIVRLRDIGERDAVGLGKGPLATSPDGRRLAFTIARAAIATNDYCRALVVLDLAPGARPQVIDRGGEYMKISAPVRGLVVSPGPPEAVTPVWSPDGREVAYRKRIDDRTEAWVARADGAGARKVARLETDVEDLAWSEDGTRLVLAWRPGLAAQRAARAREALSGYLYDDRFQPAYQMEPLPTAAPLAAVSVDLASGLTRKLDDTEAARIFPDYRPGVPAPRQALSPSGRRAQLAPAAGGRPGAMRVSAEGSDGRMTLCMAASCTGRITTLFWQGQAVVFVRLEGWALGTYALYRWKPGSSAPRRILAGEDLLYGCVPGARAVICGIENATSPRRIEAIDPSSGRRQVLFNPNPEFRALRLGAVRRIKLRSSLGFEAWADLVLPPGYRGGRIPLVVVQYRSRGFLRGGVGADYPIQAIAARGMAVLSFERPEGPGDTKANEAEMLAANTRGWADRRSVLDALERAIDEAVRLGIADPERIGMTGLSDGATTAAFALINSRIKLAAVAMSSCCMEREFVSITGGPRFAEAMKAEGYPPIGHDDPAFWAPMSLAQNAERIDTPILMQLADREYTNGLETWTALVQAGKPVEMIVYPDEYHNKWQPAHLYANYVRSLDWFDFWFFGRKDPEPAKAAQYARWDELRRLRDRARGRGS
ncbi:Atxe2 family lasso peptide isopeptidase [Novosphingobium sp. G106]|uniref:Atxe2 family lasso peptide isopeptidase n=1 Tax=Novosphingobium sp. G106 TaxID=2849500 RepID=UPI001C2D0DEA|nr:Atxe2 family lasso peptide isopeptidase [Novosphingobium sp. G106]MBV1691391.1 Atxe2 family lasso peptide isopeptidase [Novosphingobium sp. G106]